MNNFDYSYGIGVGAPVWMHTYGSTLLLLVLWSLFWKGIALWHSAKRNQPWWFVALLIINTAGILEIIYLFLVIKLKPMDLFSKK